MSTTALRQCEQDFSQLNLDVVFGRSGGRIIWQPRISAWVLDRLFIGQLPPPYTGMDFPEIYKRLGCSARIYEYNNCFKRIEHPAVTTTKRSLNDTDTEIVIETPVGRQVAVYRKTPSSPAFIHLKREISSEEEMRVAIWRAENTSWQWDQPEYERIGKKWGKLGAPIMYMPRVNIQDLYINTMGTQNAIYALYDWPDAVQAYFSALDDCHDRLIDVINASPIQIINFGDNLHGGTLPPELFKKHVLPSYQRRCEQLHRAGKFVHSHWDGDTKTLLPFARETGLDGIEAITPVPQGDVTLEEVKAALGNDMFLVDGIPAILFDVIYDAQVLEEYTHRIIKLFAPRLVLGISDEISSTGDLERIRIVGKIVDDYNASCK
jgi:hypothetical protein